MKNNEIWKNRKEIGGKLLALVLYSSFFWGVVYPELCFVDGVVVENTENEATCTQTEDNEETIFWKEPDEKEKNNSLVQKQKFEGALWTEKRETREPEEEVSMECKEAEIPDENTEEALQEAMEEGRVEVKFFLLELFK